MATPLENLISNKGTLTSQLRSSNTAYTPNTVPTMKDASLTMQIDSINKQIEDAKSTALRNEWYGKADTSGGDTTSTAAPSDGWVMGGLKALQKPMNAIAGTVQYALGKGTAPTLSENVNNAMKNGLTYGNILNQEGMTNRVASGLLGFGLDVAMDPINWLTMGTAALVPRVGLGLVKGGLTRAAVDTAAELGTKGAITGFDAVKAVDAGVTGLTSNLAEKAHSVLNMIPGVKTASALTPMTEEFAKELGKPGLTLADNWRNLVQKGASKITGLKDQLGNTAIKGAEKYDTLMGENLASKLGKGMFGENTGMIGKGIEDVLKGTSPLGKLPILSNITKSGKTVGENLINFFKYSPADTAKMADLKDQIINAGKATGLNINRSNKAVDFLDINDALSKDATINLSTLTKKVADSIAFKADELGNVLIRDKVTGAIIPELEGKIKVADTIDNAKQLLGTAIDQVNLDHLNKIYKDIVPGKAGVQWYDDVIDKAKATTFNDMFKIKSVDPAIEKSIENWNTMNGVAGKFANMNPGQWKPFNAILTGLEKFTSIFKWMKVPLNPGSHVVANLGNYFMGAMLGLPVGDIEFLSSISKADALLKGKMGITGIKAMFFDDTNLLIKMADENPTRFRQVFGFGADELATKIGIEDLLRKDIPQNIIEAKKFMSEAFDDIARAREQMMDITKVEELRKAVESGTVAEESLTNIQRLAVRSRTSLSTAGETALKNLRSGTFKEIERGGTFTTEELNSGIIADFQAKIKQMLLENPSNPAAKFADFIVNTMPRGYEHIDQTFKIGTVDFLSRIGLTEEQLIKISRNIHIDPTDILDPVISGGKKLYKLKPLKASEVAMEAFMNYAAMPDFVKVMRALPILGSNFYSFQYAMGIKSAKTLIHNPAVFNKIGYMLNEITGTRSPEEKIALQNKYNQYINSPTVIKLLGMYNTDVKNIIPIYGMNMFNPSEKTYANTTQGNLLKTLDSLPLGQTPIGQMLKDFWIQPWLLSGTGQAPQGQFGQPLYPIFDEKGNLIDPSLLTKLLYSTRTVAEALVPGVASYAGLPIGMANVDPSIINLIPSYGMRSVANAAEGRSSIGAMTKQNKIEKTFRTLSSRTGIPLYPLDTTTISTKDLQKK